MEYNASVGGNMNIEAEYKYLIDKIPKENAIKKDILQFYIKPT